MQNVLSKDSTSKTFWVKAYHLANRSYKDTVELSYKKKARQKEASFPADNQRFSWQDSYEYDSSPEIAAFETALYQLVVKLK